MICYDVIKRKQLTIEDFIRETARLKEIIKSGSIDWDLTKA